MDTKTCTKCKEEKPLTDFYQHRTSRGGHRSVCKPCGNAAQAAYHADRYANDPEYRDKCDAKTARWRANNPERSKDLLLTSTHGQRAARIGAASERVEYAEVIRRGNSTCGICHGPVEPGTESLDHIIPLSKGGSHTYENCQLAHLSCNQRKGSAA